MFFIMGINTGRKDLDFSQMMICPSCGQYGRITIYMTYTVLSLFFIPVFKWNRHYYAVSSCCHRTWHLDKDMGRRILRGEAVSIRPEDLDPVADQYTCRYQNYRSDMDYRSGRYSESDSKADQDMQQEEAWYIGQDKPDGRSSSDTHVKICGQCGYRTDEDFAYCPKCGNKL